MFLHHLAHEVTQELAIEHYSINHKKHKTLIREMSWAQFIENQVGIGCFGPIRIGGVDPCIPKDLNVYSIILHLRDPRDVLTSRFFHRTYGQKSKHIQASEREYYEQAGIDTFILDNIQDFKQRYDTLIANFLGRENVILIYYEEMVSDYSTWLTHFLSAFSHIPMPKPLLSVFGGPNTLTKIHQKLYKKHENDFSVVSENKYKQIRQITPGDHKRKLKPETLEKLNSEFREILDTLNYDL